MECAGKTGAPLPSASALHNAHLNLGFEGSLDVGWWMLNVSSGRSLTSRATNGKAGPRVKPRPGLRIAAELLIDHDPIEPLGSWSNVGDRDGRAGSQHIRDGQPVR